METITQTLLSRIADPGHTRYSVALVYAEAIRAGIDSTDWPVVNRAIMHRWSVSALQFIKQQAWKRAYPKMGLKSHDDQRSGGSAPSVRPLTGTLRK